MDKLELSDDDDFECHPNVDKASFIRWKQADIHAKREERARKIEFLKQQISQNESLLERISNMVKQLEMEGIDSFMRTIEQLRETNQKLEAEKEKPEGEEKGKEEKEQKQLPFGVIMSALLVKIQEEVKHESPDKVKEGLIKKLNEHYEKLSNIQKENKIELEKEEVERKKKIIMDDMQTGFDKAVVNTVKRPELTKPKKKTAKKTKDVEVLNPNVQMKPLDDKNKPFENKDDRGEEGDDEEEEDEESLVLSDIARQFAEINDYDKSLQFITKHPEVVSQEVVDQILGEAFRAQLKGKAKYAKRCVHQGWLLQYCQKLGKDGVTIFFKRISSPDPQAREIFLKDVNETYERIIERCKVMNEEKPQQTQVEQIQIEITDPNSSLNVRIPDENSDKYPIYMTLPEDFREALKTDDIKKINKVLGEMSSEDAEKVLEICGEAEVLTIEETLTVEEPSTIKKSEES